MYVTISKVFPLVLLYNCISITQGIRRKMVVEFTKMEVENLRPEVLNIQYKINRTSSNISAIYTNFTVSEDVKNLTGSFSLRMKYTDKFINYINVDVDYCKGLQNIYSQYFLQMVANGIRSVSNYPLDCPLKKNQLYYINGFTINTDIIPSYFPTITFVADATYVTNRRLALRIDVTGILKKK